MSAITRIADIIGKVNEYQTTIAAAVEEQTVTSNEINRGVTEAASATGEIASNIGAVASAVQVTNEGVADSQQTARDLARMSTELEALVKQFTV